MTRTKKTSVYFIATKIKQQPAVVNFYTKEGKSVSRQDVEKVETKQGTEFYTFAAGQ